MTWYSRWDSNPQQDSAPRLHIERRTGQTVKLCYTGSSCDITFFWTDPFAILLMARAAGVEPTNLGSEPSVLPLD